MTAEPKRELEPMKPPVPVRATAKASPKLVLTVNNADNELIAYLNSEQVYDRKTEFDPTFNDVTDLSSKLVRGHNSLVILGINWGGPAHFAGNVTLDGKVLIPLTYALPNPGNGVVAAWSSIVDVA